MTMTAEQLAERYRSAADAPAMDTEADWILDDEKSHHAAEDWYRETVKGRKNPSQRRWVHRTKKGPNGKPLVVYSDTNPGGKAKGEAKPAAAAPKPKPAAQHPLAPGADKRPAKAADDALGQAIANMVEPTKKAEATAKPKAEPKAKPKAERPAGKTSKEIDNETLARAEANPEPYLAEYLDPDRYPGKENENVTYDSSGKLVSVALNTDEFRDLFPEYVGTNSGEVHEACSLLNKALYAKMLEEMKGRGNGRLIILAGGGGSGKGSATKKHFSQQEYPIRLDQVTGELKQAEKKFDQAIKAGWEQKDFEFCFVDRDPSDAWNAGVVNRALNLRKKGELARTVGLQREDGSGAYQDNLNARKTALEIMKKYPDMPVRIIDNNHGNDNSVLIRERDKAIAFLEAQIAKHEAAGDLRPQLRDKTLARHDSGEIPEDILRGLLGDKAVDEHLAKKANRAEDVFELPEGATGSLFDLPSDRSGGSR